MPEKIPLLPGLANQHRPTSATVDCSLGPTYLYGVLADLWMWWIGTVRVGDDEWAPKEVLLEGDTAAAGGQDA
jgi:hypothetical protein